MSKEVFGTLISIPNGCACTGDPKHVTTSKIKEALSILFFNDIASANKINSLNDIEKNRIEMGKGRAVDEHELQGSLTT